MRGFSKGSYSGLGPGSLPPRGQNQGSDPKFTLKGVVYSVGPKKRFLYNFLNVKYIIYQYNFNQHLILYLSTCKQIFLWVFVFYIRRYSSLKSAPRKKGTLMVQVILGVVIGLSEKFK